MNQSLLLDLKKPSAPALNLFRLQIARLVAEYCRELGVECKQIKLRPLRSRWGSCTAAGVITINLKLRDAPGALLEYVVYHECLHLVYKNHGSEFQARLRSKFPNYRHFNRLLKTYGTKLFAK
ncbi:MAG TPA: M48 family metallopeptidase [Candidatus Doudnabacteria bacterium]|nr:M48 family metallopeptidase [Candidatus Doudnabacteria bacterium]